MKKIILIFLATLLFSLVFKLLFLAPADKKTKLKVALIRFELKRNGLNPIWIVISEHRSSWYNSILKNSSKNSYHLKGKAIDLFLVDVNSDGKFDMTDINLIKQATKNVEKQHPELLGALGTYTTKGWPSNKMIHIDTRGYQRYYNY